MERTIFLGVNNAGVDALLLRKSEAIPAIAKSYGVSLERIAAIGDGAIDLPLLQVEGLGLAGAPANARDDVKKVVGAMPHGIITAGEVLDGFFEFYAHAKKQGITHIVSDRDGVLVSAGDHSRAEEFKQMARKMGKDGNPYVMVLTGSGVSQNSGFMEAYGLSKELSGNPGIEAHPYLVLAEGGAIHVNVLTGETMNLVDKLDQVLLAQLKGPFQDEVLARVEREVLPAFGLTWSEEYKDQTGKVYVPPKQSMVTLNVPRKFSDGTPDYRKSPEAERYRQAVVAIMREGAEELGISYEMLT